MLKAIETTGKNEEEAISAALRELGKGRDEVSVEILERSKSGFLGIGAVPAKVRVSYEYVESNAEKAEVFLKGLLERLGSDAVPVVESGLDEKGEECLSVNLTGEKLGMLIGRRGPRQRGCRGIPGQAGGIPEEPGLQGRGQGREVPQEYDAGTHEFL